jgi:hypothetical protein
MNSKLSKTLYFNLDISHDEFLCYYKGIVNQVIVTTADNTKIQFPVQFIKKFVRHDGIHGRFKIVYDENNKLVSLDKLAG